MPMSAIVSQSLQQSMERASWIRRMFEEGARLKAEHGEDQVHDFSLGNPILEPPPGVHAALRELLEQAPAGMHRYPPNAGLVSAREFVAGELREATGQDYGPQHVVMTCGAAGGLNIALKALLNPGDEVVTFAPYFVEYGFYAANHGGTLVAAETDDEFQPDLESLRSVLTERTRAVILNAPNNPTGVIYPQRRLEALAEALREASQRFGRPIFLLSDEPYRKVVFDGAEVPWLPALYEHTIVITSHSKDLGLPAERIGYAAVSPQAADHTLLLDAMVMANRILGFVNAPGLWQRVLPHLKGQHVDVGYYQRLRDRMVAPLREMGYRVVQPQGAFYLFPQSPTPDDMAFVRAAQAERLLVVPGSGFGRPGYFRISLAVTPEAVERALPVFERLISA